MQTTEIFSTLMEEKLKAANHGPLKDFLAISHTSIPEIQENLLYVCASKKASVERGCEYSFSGLDAFLAAYVTDGSGIIDVNGDTQRLYEGSLLLWDCMDYIKFKCEGSPLKLDMIYFSGDSAQIYYEEICKVRFPIFAVSEDSVYASFIRQLLALGPITSPHHAIMGNKILHNLLSDLVLDMHIVVSQKDYTPTYIIDLKELYDTEYMNSHPLDELSERFHVSKYRLTREFSQYIGTSPLKYLNEVRLFHAKVMLESTDLPVAVIGENVGIPNTTHFINLFKSKNGMTPLSYREKYNSFLKIPKDREGRTHPL